MAKAKKHYSGIGGQAVLEGIMMKNKTRYAVAVRKPDGEIDVEISEYKGILGDSKIMKMPNDSVFWFQVQENQRMQKYL